jgi:hypothetical protein
MGRRQRHHPEMGPHGNFDIAQDVEILLDRLGSTGTPG